MNALDTNVLVRFLVKDDPAQAEKARKLLARAEARGETVMVTQPVLLELLWVLDAVYDVSREAILDTLELLLTTAVFDFQAREATQELLSLGRTTAIDLPDLLIGLSAWEAECESALTFDKRAARSELFELVR